MKSTETTRRGARGWRGHERTGRTVLAAALTLALPACDGGRARTEAAAGDSAVVAARIAAVEGDVACARLRVAGAPPRTLVERMAHHHVNALSVAVIHAGRIEWARAWGLADVEEPRPATSATLFQPGSISKSLNAVALLRLVQSGRVDLDADINRYLVSWHFPYDSVAAGAVITPGMLLSHTAGLSVHGFRGYAPGAPLPTVAQILDGRPPAVNEPVRSRLPPGLRYKYSGGGTMIAQQLLMDLTGRPYDACLRDSVLAPLGMTASSFTQPPPPEEAPRRATGYTAGGARVPGGHTVLAEQAAGGLWTTPTDLARFVLEVQRARHGRGRLLGRTMARQMTAPYLEGSPGLGVFLEEIGGVPYFTHAAGNIGFSGVFYGGLERDDGVVACVNTDEGLEMLKEVVATVARVYAWPGFEAAVASATRDTVQVPAGLAVRAAGLYREKSTVTELAWDGARLRQRVAGMTWDVHFSAPSNFFSEESATEKRLACDAAGAVTGFTRLVEGDSVGWAARAMERPLSDSLVARFAGCYRDPDQEPLFLRRAPGGGLLLEREETPRAARFLSEREFFTREDPGQVFTLECDARGVVTGITVRTGDRREWCPRTGS